MTKEIIAVSAQEAMNYGCPHCGGIFGTSPVSGGGSQIWECADCGKISIYLADGVQKSTIGIGDYCPELQPHPRRGQPVDRAKLIADRKRRIDSEAFTDLSRWLLLGHGQSAQMTKVGSHTSKSRLLPIIATDGSENVRVTWFGNNYHSYFLGVELERPIPATLLYPISSIFGTYALSGHVNRDIAPPLTNFQKSYHNCKPVKTFGGECYNGFQSALVIRYLEKASKLDTKAILDVCLRKTCYGSTDNIDGNGIEFEKLAQLLDLSYDNVIYDFDVKNAPAEIFERLNVDWFDSDLVGGKSSVHVTMRKNILLPTLSLPAEIFVDLKDTELNLYIPREMQERPTRNIYSDYLIFKIPARLLYYQKNRTPEENLKLREGIKYPVHSVYASVNIGTRDFTFHVPNVLDCALTAFFFIKVLAPIIKEMQLIP